MRSGNRNSARCRVFKRTGGVLDAEDTTRLFEELVTWRMESGIVIRDSSRDWVRHYVVHPRQNAVQWMNVQCRHRPHTSERLLSDKQSCLCKDHSLKYFRTKISPLHARLPWHFHDNVANHCANSWKGFMTMPLPSRAFICLIVKVFRQYSISGTEISPPARKSPMSSITSCCSVRRRARVIARQPLPFASLSCS